jgi:hypothetical protein
MYVFSSPSAKTGNPPTPDQSSNRRRVWIGLRIRKCVYWAAPTTLLPVFTQSASLVQKWGVPYFLVCTAGRRSSRGNIPSYNVMPTQTRIFACLVFLMLGWSAVDALPDPPALRSRSELNNAVTPFVDHVAALRETSHTDSSAGRTGTRAFSIRLMQGCEIAQPSCIFFIRHATDASPPRFS